MFPTAAVPGAGKGAPGWRAGGGSPSASRGDGTTADATLPGVWVQCSVV